MNQSDPPVFGLGGTTSVSSDETVHTAQIETQCPIRANAAVKLSLSAHSNEEL